MLRIDQVWPPGWPQGRGHLLCLGKQICGSIVLYLSAAWLLHAGARRHGVQWCALHECKCAWQVLMVTACPPPYRSSWPRWQAAPSRARAAWTMRIRHQSSLSARICWSRGPWWRRSGPPSRLCHSVLHPAAVSTLRYLQAVGRACPGAGVGLATLGHLPPTPQATVAALAGRRRPPQPYSLVCDTFLVQIQPSNSDKLGKVWYRGAGQSWACCALCHMSHMPM